MKAVACCASVWDSMSMARRSSSFISAGGRLTLFVSALLCLSLAATVDLRLGYLLAVCAIAFALLSLIVAIARK